MGLSYRNTARRSKKNSITVLESLFIILYSGTVWLILILLQLLIFFIIQLPSYVMIFSPDLVLSVQGGGRGGGGGNGKKKLKWVVIGLQISSLVSD